MLGPGLNPGRRQHRQVAAAAVHGDVVAVVADRLSRRWSTPILRVTGNVVAVKASRAERLVGVMNDVTRRGHQLSRLSRRCRCGRGRRRYRRCR